ncbi:MAG: PilN domain-containing protein, partial [Pseudomonadota bacterium]
FEARQIARSIEGAAGGGTNAAFAAHQAHAVAPAPGTVVTAMTEVLPDDTYLDRLTIEGERIQAVGLSTQATALVGLLDADPRFAEPRYAAPITQTGTGEARFLIEARFRRAEDEQ